jgi:hypothetical protein
MQRELQRPEIEAKPDWHGRNEVEAIKRQDEEAAISLAFAELGAGCSKDGLGQDVPATRKRCPAGCVAQRAGRRRSPLIKRLICLPSSVFRLLSSVLCPLSSVLCPLSSVLCPLSSDLCPLSSDLCPLSSVLCPLSSVLCPLSSVLCPPTSVLRPLSSDLCLLSPLETLTH